MSTYADKCNYVRRQPSGKSNGDLTMLGSFSTILSITLPFPENAPTSTPVRQHQTSPSPSFPNLNDRLPNAAIRSIAAPRPGRTDCVIAFP